MKEFLTRGLVYGLLTFVILNGIAFVNLYFLRKSSFYKPQFIMNGVTDNTFDYVILGSSTGLTTLDTKLIDSLSRKNGLNISIDDSGMSSHYLMLLHFYASGKKTKCLVLAITPRDAAVTDPGLNDNDYRFLPNINEDCVVNYYKEMEKSDFGRLSLSRYFPILGVSYYNIEIFFPSIVAALRPEQRNRFDNKGNYSYPISGGVIDTPNRTEILKLNNPYYLEIKKFCMENKIELLLYQSPIFKTTVISDGDERIINHSDFIKDPVFFYDNIHVNSKGRRICSFEFARYLMSKN